MDISEAVINIKIDTSLFNNVFTCVSFCFKFEMDSFSQFSYKNTCKLFKFPKAKNKNKLKRNKLNK